jgi:hypothetical protein
VWVFVLYALHVGVISHPNPSPPPAGSIHHYSTQLQTSGPPVNSRPHLYLPPVQMLTYWASPVVISVEEPAWQPTLTLHLSGGVVFQYL